MFLPAGFQACGSKLMFHNTEQPIINLLKSYRRQERVTAGKASQSEQSGIDAWKEEEAGFGKVLHEAIRSLEKDCFACLCNTLQQQLSMTGPCPKELTIQILTTWRKQKMKESTA